MTDSFRPGNSTPSAPSITAADQSPSADGAVEQLEWDAPLVTEQPSPAALQVQRDASEQPILDRLDEAVASLESAMTSAFDADLDTDALAGIAAQIEGLHAQLQSALAELDH